MSGWWALFYWLCGACFGAAVVNMLRHPRIRAWWAEWRLRRGWY